MGKGREAGCIDIMLQERLDGWAVTQDMISEGSFIQGKQRVYAMAK
jgi:hypothetical protein